MTANEVAQTASLHSCLHSHLGVLDLPSSMWRLNDHKDRLKNVSGPDLWISHIKQPSGKDLGVARGRMNRKLSSP